MNINPVVSTKYCSSLVGVCGRHGVVILLWRVEDLLEGLEDGGAVGEHPVGEEERVQEVDIEEAEVGEALQQPLRGGVPDLRNLHIVKKYSSDPSFLYHVVIITRRKCSSRTCSGNASNVHYGMLQI